MKKSYLLGAVYACFFNFVATSTIASEPTLVAVCEGGSTSGSRTEINQSGHSVKEDKTTLSSIVYMFDVPEKGMVQILYGKNEVIGTILNEHHMYKTVVYTFGFGGVSYMDTVFIETGKVLSSEHKYLFGAAIATTWRIDCAIE